MLFLHSAERVVYDTVFEVHLQRNVADPPSDSAAVLDWSQAILDANKRQAPLAIAMQSSREGLTRFRRYRLVVARKDSLQTGSETTKVLNKLDKSLPQCLLGSIDDYIYGYAAHEYRSPLWLLWVRTGVPILIHKRSGHT